MSKQIRQKFTENAEQFDALMVEMLEDRAVDKALISEMEHFMSNYGGGFPQDSEEKSRLIKQARKSIKGAGSFSNNRLY